jgi:hypothetical protein
MVLPATFASSVKSYHEEMQGGSITVQVIMKITATNGSKKAAVCAKLEIGKPV